MYYSILGQKNITDILQNEISYHPPALAHSMIFHGNRYTGRLSAALETARLLNCTENGADDCNCGNCNAMRNFTFGELIILSRRNYYYEIIETLSRYRQQKLPHLRNKLYRAIRLSFAPLPYFLIENTAIAETDRKQLQTLGDKFSDFIDKPEYSSAELEEIEKGAAFFLTLYKNKNIPVNTIRNMLDWSYLTSGAKKVVIIDDVDQLDSSSENVLLKRLEEPADNLYFILLAENNNRILQTIRSRCRTYFFRNLLPEYKNQILQEIYLEENPENYSSLYSFFHQKDPISQKNLQPKISKLVNLIFQQNLPFSELYLFIEGEKNRDIHLGIMKELHAVFERELLARENKNMEREYTCLQILSTQILKEADKDLRLRFERTLALNLTPKTQLEGLLYPLKEFVLHDIKQQLS